MVATSGCQRLTLEAPPASLCRLLLGIRLARNFPFIVLPLPQVVCTEQTDGAPGHV